jgi:hypothetical protein
MLKSEDEEGVHLAETKSVGDAYISSRQSHNCLEMINA